MKVLGRRDDGTYFFNGRDLEAIDNVLYRTKKKELRARSRFPNIKDLNDPAAETYTYFVIDAAGVAKIFAYGSDDIPYVDLAKTEKTLKIKPLVLGAHFTIQEKRRADKTGQPMDAEKMSAVRRGINEKENNLFFKGDEVYDIVGLYTAEGIQFIAVSAIDVNGVLETKWENKNGEQILEDLRIVRYMADKTPGISVSQLALPGKHYAMLDKQFNSNTTKTIRDILNDRGWFSAIEEDDELKGIGPNGEDALALIDDDPDYIQPLLGMEMEPKDAFKINEFKWRMTVEERFGGAIVRFPLAITLGFGI